MIGSWEDVPATVSRIFARPERFEWLLVEQEETTEPQRAAVRDACHGLGKLCGVWESQVDFGTPAHTADGFDCYVGQVEGPGQYARLQASLAAFRAAHPAMPAAVVTNFGGLETAELAKPLIDAGFACIPETWVKTDGVTPERRATYARNIGFLNPQPFAGLGEKGATMADYPTITDFAGYSVFGAEQLIG